jgi:hypothetical protein
MFYSETENDGVNLASEKIKTIANICLSTVASFKIELDYDIKCWHNNNEGKCMIL